MTTPGLEISGWLVLQIASYEMFDFRRCGRGQQVMSEGDDREQDNNQDGKRGNLHTRADGRRAVRSFGAAEKPEGKKPLK